MSSDKQHLESTPIPGTSVQLPIPPDTRHPTPDTRAFSAPLHSFAIAFVIATFLLLVLGGTVTSKGAGLAVPDWPSTFEYNMFLFPPSMWVGGIFWEHTHRLMGTVVGLMAIVLCIWLWKSNTQSPRTPVRGSTRPWLKYLGVATLIMVIAQGIMGGLRVTQLSTWLAVFHGMTGQFFLCMTVLIAAATSRWWIEREGAVPSATAMPSLSVRPLADQAVKVLVILLIQLALGATVRHHGAGLAIPDFPLSYGKLIPPMNQADIETAMIAFSDKPDSYGASDHAWYTPFHVIIHWAHRLWAIAVVGEMAHLIARILRRAGHETRLRFPAIALGVMVVFQVTLGATTIWTGRHPEIATAHQTLGAILLATTALVYFRIRLLSSGEPRSATMNPMPAHLGRDVPAGRHPMVATSPSARMVKGAGS